MPLSFQTLRSSSSANCALLWTERTAILFDCGLKTQAECRELLAAHLPGRLDAVLVSHTHSDHIGYPALRALARLGAPIHIHEDNMRRLCQWHAPDSWPAVPDFRPFAGESFVIGDLCIEPIELPHDPDTPTFGFVVRHGRCGVKAVLCTDFHNFADVLPHFIDADLIFVESNHDPDLLRLHPNYASRWHMSNAKTAWLLYHATTRSRRPAQTVILGHLSRQRNTPDLALAAVTDIFSRQGAEIPFRLLAAPLYEPSRPVTVVPDSRIAPAADFNPRTRMSQPVLFPV